MFKGYLENVDVHGGRVLTLVLESVGLTNASHSEIRRVGREMVVLGVKLKTINCLARWEKYFLWLSWGEIECC